jgi:hypothetical protein
MAEAEYNGNSKQNVKSVTYKITKYFTETILTEWREIKPFRKQNGNLI